MKRTLWLATGLAALALCGCTGESKFPEATGKGSVRAINAITTAPEVQFLNEERPLAVINFKEISNSRLWDDLEYNFNFDAILNIADGPTRVATQFIDVVKDRNYTIVLTGSLAAPVTTVWEKDIRVFEESDTVFEARFSHLAAAESALDVYFLAPETAPSFGTQIATLSFGEVLEPADFAGGEYVLTLVAAGADPQADPDSVVFTSGTLALPERNAFTFSVFDGDPNNLSQVAVRLFTENGGSSVITEVGVLPTIQFVQASLAVAAADVYLGDVTQTTPIIENHLFGDISGDIPVAAGDNALTYTATGGTAVILFEDAITALSATHLRYVLVGAAEALDGIFFTTDRRPVESFVKLTVMHAASNHENVDVFIVDAGTDIAEAQPRFFSLPFGFVPPGATLDTGNYDVYVTTDDEAQTVITGPYALDVTRGDVVDLLILDTVDPASAEITTIPLP